MIIWGKTDTGIVRQQNQDAMFFERLSEDTYLAVVCDGMGGAAAGNIASELAISVFVGSIREALQEDCPLMSDVLRRACVEANSAVIDRANHNADYAGMGTTLVAALVQGETVHVANVGDSRAYYVSETGISRITRDHSLVEDLVARGELTEEEARNHPQRNLITRALGAEDSIEVDVYTHALEQGSYILLCSDGLSNMLSGQEILFEIIHGGESADCCERLVHLACSRGAPDNVTVVLLKKGGMA
jgi:Serine/threonine protein phosphatase